MDGVSQGSTCPAQTVDVVQVQLGQEELLYHAFAALQHLLAGSQHCLRRLPGSLHKTSALRLGSQRGDTRASAVDSQVTSKTPYLDSHGLCVSAGL